MSHVLEYLEETSRVAREVSAGTIEMLAEALAEVRNNGGRLFILGLGGSAANASHAVNDFRKLCEIEAYAPTDNVSELTARANDNGQNSIFRGYLYGSRFQSNDALLILSVGGGSDSVSYSLVIAAMYAREVGAKVFGIIGRDGGYVANLSDVCVIVPTINSDRVTPHTESFQSVVLHCLVSHPLLQVAKTKW